MIGEEHQLHVCNMPYGDRYGERFSKVSTVHKSRKRKGTLNVDHLYKMIWEDYTYQHIARELQINPNIVKDHFREEGLIE